MAAAHAVIEAPFVADQVGQGRGFGGIDRIEAIDSRVALGAVVVDQQQGFIQGDADLLVGGQQFIAPKAGVEALHQQLRAVAVQGQAAGAFLAAVKQPVAVGALGMQFGKQRLAVVEGGAQRLVESRHAWRLGKGKVGSLA